MTVINENWQIIFQALEETSETELVYVLGASDTGKTTFCRFLQKNLLEEFPTAYIDCDPGQSFIGPPTTLGLRFYPLSGQKGKRHHLYFVGSTSPLRHLLQTLSGIKKLTDRAAHLGAKKIILDSSGFVLGKPAQEFQFQVIDLIQPDHLVILQQSDELQSLSLNFERHQSIKIHRLGISSAVIARTQEERQIYREEKFKTYFRSAELQDMSWEGIGFHGMVPDLYKPM